MLVSLASPLNATQIANPPAATAEVSTNDFIPSDVAQFGVIANLHSAYFIAAGTTGPARAMTGVGAPLTVPFAGTYSIEMPNVDLTGWVGKTYDLSGNRTGSGQRASILHIVPADENATPQSSAIQVFDYKARFSMPVHVALDTPTPFQSL